MKLAECHPKPSLRTPPMATAGRLLETLTPGFRTVDGAVKSFPCVQSKQNMLECSCSWREVVSVGL